jgi:tRNA(adenine34) deaminase
MPSSRRTTETTFEQRVTQAQALVSGDLRQTERAVATRRVAWLEQAGFAAATDWPATGKGVSPRQAYELLFRDYMGLELTELPVEEESESRITWLSGNPCPTLEACLRLGLDTRTICRAVYEKPVQLFLSRLDPSLRFVRDYDQIRPHAPHCRESIVRLDLGGLMRQALNQALPAKAEGNKGYGALVVVGDRVVTCEHDTATTDGDPSRHAELKAICEAANLMTTPDLCGALLVSTCEPCPMCASLAVWANITTIIYGSSIEATAAMGRTRIMVGAVEIAERSRHTVEVFGGLLKDECDRLYA